MYPLHYYKLLPESSGRFSVRSGRTTCFATTTGMAIPTGRRGRTRTTLRWTTARCRRIGSANLRSTPTPPSTNTERCTLRAVSPPFTSGTWLVGIIGWIWLVLTHHFKFAYMSRNTALRSPVFQDSGFAGVILIKKAGDGSKKIKGCWDSIHVVEVQEKSSGRSAHYKLTSTSMLWLQTNKVGSGTMNLGGSLTRQVRCLDHILC